MKPLLNGWLGGYDEKTKTYLCFIDPIESLKPKLIHVREVDPKKEKKEKEEAAVLSCLECDRPVIPKLKVCKEHYLKRRDNEDKRIEKNRLAQQEFRKAINKPDINPSAVDNAKSRALWEHIRKMKKIRDNE